METFSDLVKVGLFFAFRPPRHLCLDMETLSRCLRRAHRISGPVTAANLLHNTLAPIDCRSVPLGSAVARARQVAADIRYPSFPVRYDWTGSFVGRLQNHPLVLRGEDGLASLRELREQMVVRMRRAGLATDRGFTPHITLLWGDRLVGDNPVLPFEWRVEEFVLVLSLIGHSRHVELGRWRLH